MSAQTRKEFVSDQDVRWCPGCGDYAILAQVQKVLPDLGVPRENVVFISGIGCSSRFPYYVNTYGVHSIHGRAPTLATGLKMTRPDLSVWIVTGDGDALSIGGNHLIHLLRRNLDVTILLFNNRIYGLTKGQYSPTSETGKRTKSTPMGSVDHPFDPVQVALGAGGSFVARSVDVDTKHLQAILRRAHAHRGTSFVEILQNCNVFNDGAFESLTNKATKAEHTLAIEHGRPLVFADGTRGIRITEDFTPEVVPVAGDPAAAGVLVYDETNPAHAFLVSHLAPPAFPTALGVFSALERPCYEDGATNLIRSAERADPPDLGALLRQGDVWTVS